MTMKHFTPAPAVVGLVPPITDSSRVVPSEGEIGTFNPHDPAVSAAADTLCDLAIFLARMHSPVGRRTMEVEVR